MKSMMFQTVDRDSLFTELDFRSKLALVAAVTIIAFLWDSPITGVVMLAMLVVLALGVGVKASYIKLIGSIMVVFGLIMVITHGFFNTQRLTGMLGRPLTPIFTFPESWWLIGGGALSLEGVLFGLGTVCRTLCMVLVIPIAIFTSDVNSMVTGLVKLRVPYKITFVFSSTMRYFPLLFEEVQSIIEAQRLRGLAVEKMGPVKKVKVYAKIAIPLILSSLSKSQMMEVVLQSKAFTGNSDRTYLHDSVLKKKDTAIIALSVFFLVVAIVLRTVWGVGKFSWLMS